MRYVSVMALGFALLAGSALADEGGKKDLEKLVGTWNVVSMDSGNGAKVLPKGFTIVISDKSMEMRSPGGGTQKLGDITRIDGAAKPAQIDRTDDTKAKTGLGIYELNGDDLKLIVQNWGEERVKEFKGSPKGKLYVLTREKK